jgi:hypothetical protein
MSATPTEWKWSKPEPYSQSKRQPAITKPTLEIEEKIESDAYLSSLHHDQYSWDIINQTQSNFKSSSKREDADKKISEREVMPQDNFNPFFTKNDYINDVENRDLYMKPVITREE